MGDLKKETTGKIGLFSAIMIMFGATVGIGIFFKNNSVFRANNNNWLGVLLSWVITAVIAVCIALSFSEIASCKLKNKNDGLGGWAKELCGNKLGRFSSLFYITNFYPLVTASIIIFASEAIFNLIYRSKGMDSINFGSGTTSYVFLLGGGLFALFTGLNYVSSKAMSKFSNVTGIAKFIPLVAVVVLGIVGGTLFNNGGLWTGHVYGSNEAGKFDLIGMISVLPAILFAFDGYLVIGNIAGDMKNPEKNVSLSVVIAMIIITIFNLLITIGCMTAGTGDVYSLVKVICNNNQTAIKAMSIIMSILIMICILGVLNALIFSGMRALQANCENGSLFKSKVLIDAKPGNKLFAGTIYFSIIVGFWWALLFIPSAIVNSDCFVDGSSNILMILVYCVYGIIITGGFANRFTKKVEVRKVKIFPVTAVIGILACLFVFCFVSIYQFTVLPILDPHGFSASKGWGLFIDQSLSKWHVGDKAALSNVQASITYWIVAALMISLPFINDGLIKGFDKNNTTTLIWQKSKKEINIKTK